MGLEMKVPFLNQRHGSMDTKSCTGNRFPPGGGCLLFLTVAPGKHATSARNLLPVKKRRCIVHTVM